MKKTLTVYTMLFLFAFTFALSFTPATPAQAEPICCGVEWCPNEGEPYIALEGWWTWVQGEGMQCIWDPVNHPECTQAYPCDET